MKNKKVFNRKKIRLIILLLLTVIIFTGCNSEVEISKNSTKESQELDNKILLEEKSIEISRLIIEHDEDGDGIKDLDDILDGARKDAQNKPRYHSAYYRGGYPPDYEGVCTDTIWRAFKSAGYNLKQMVDKDIKENTNAYPRVNGEPDPNIDFRRVPNLISFFKSHATVLTTEIITNDAKNLEEWQGGDIVVFGKPVDHIAIISDIRRKDGVPYIIHNGGPYTKEEDALLYWHENISPIIYHFRFPEVD